MALTEKLEALELSVDQNIILNNEVLLLEESLLATSEVFKVKIKQLINQLEKRGSSTQQIINVLVDDFDRDGAIFGGLKRGFTSDAVSTVSNVDTRISVSEWEDQYGKQDYTWIAALVATCEDCFPFHGVSQSYEEWVSDPGLPGSGWSVCKEHCQCIILPKSIAESKTELQKPIKRARRIVNKEAKKLDKTGAEKTAYVNRKLGRIRNTKDSLRSEFLKEKIV